MISAEDIISLRDKAEKLSRTPMINPIWKRAYENLAEAADYIALLNLRETLNEKKK